jgi:N-acetylneuraminic acid mutarotase
MDTGRAASSRCVGRKLFAWIPLPPADSSIPPGNDPCAAGGSFHLFRKPPGRPYTRRLSLRLGGVKRLAALALLVLLPAGAGAISHAASPSWRSAAPIPLPRSEVAAAAVGSEIVVVGGFLESGDSSPRVDAYSPGRNRWRRLPDLPVGVNHPMAAAARGRLYVLGGYGATGPLRTAFAFFRGRWSRLPDMPETRAAAGAAVVGRTLYVMGGVTDAGRVGNRELARTGLAFDLDRRRWTTIEGPTPREHLGVTAARGAVYVVAGRTRGFDTNLNVVEAYVPSRRAWSKLPSVPGRRGGTGATAAANSIVSVGGEATSGTIRSVYRFDLATRRWRRLPDMRTPRHGLAVVGFRGRVYALAGGPTPGLSVSEANEYLALGGSR